jgi:ribosomal-protein-alanine N-acetyltransferase
LLPSRVRLERPDASREHEFLDACRRSRSLHRGLVAVPVTSADYRAFLDDAARPTRESFLVVIAASGELAGAIDILEIKRGAVPAARLGYFAFVPHSGRGLMREGVSQVIELAFGEMGLAQLNADIQAGNWRSRALAASLGFAPTGVERSLRIGTRWVWHERWALEAFGSSSQPLAVRA